MKTLNELRAFCEGYREGMPDEDIYSADNWVVWYEYDINFAGAMYSGHARNEDSLHVDAYRAGWTDSIGDPLYSFTLD
jgi:hypothetical protein